MGLQILPKFIFLLGLLTIAHAFVEVTLQYCEQLEGQNFMDWTNVKVKKLNKTTRVFDGTAIMHIPIDDSIEVEGRLYMKQGGEYRLLPYKSSKTGACSFTQADKFFYEDVTKSSDFEFPFPCPLPNKTYEIRNFVPSYDNFPLHILRSGDYAAEGYVTRNDETLFVWRGYLSIINLA